MTWKERKQLENRNVVALGGKVMNFFDRTLAIIIRQFQSS